MKISIGDRVSLNTDDYTDLYCAPLPRGSRGLVTSIESFSGRVVAQVTWDTKLRNWAFLTELDALSLLDLMAEELA